MEETKSPFMCPKTVTVRRNPLRKARATPSSKIPLSLPLYSPSVSHDIPSFPTKDILSMELPQRPSELDSSASSQDPKKPISENLKVFLRIRPLTLPKELPKRSRNGCEDAKNAWPKNQKIKNVSKKKVKKISEICVTVKDSHSVTVSPPISLQESKRVKSEVYEGFSHVFSHESSQSEVYEKLVHPLVEDFLGGKSGMLAALGPSGSGKTHTVFGCIREPGMVPLALRHIFSQDDSNGNQLSRCFYLSMFEISEKGKSERLFDLLREGSELYIQQSAIKGLQEAIINDALQAESLIACGMLRRATAATNSNSQSSRSQCIINIRCISKEINRDSEDKSKSASLTIVDLAGAEREKKTGNQGLRMLESNFINNTSMVFGLCLRSLLEHQKNPKKQLQKYFQNSLLTRYLREYFEGRKRMALVLTVRPGEEDYLETSNLLKQASPYAQIKFSSIEELGNSKCTKRPIQILPSEEHIKRMKFSGVEPISISETRDYGDQTEREEKKNDDGNLIEILVGCEESVNCIVNGVKGTGNSNELAKTDKEHQIMVNFAKALRNVLKQYKKKLEMAENEICCLKDNLIYEKKRYLDLENVVKDLKSKSSTWNVGSAEVNGSWEVSSCVGTEFFEEQHSQEHGNSCTHVDVAETFQESKDLRAIDMHTNNGATGLWNASHSCANQRCEEAAETASPGERLQDLKDGEEDHFSLSDARNHINKKGVRRDDTCIANEGTDNSESASSYLQSCVKIGEVCPRSVEKELAISTSSLSDSAASSSLSPVRISGQDSSAVGADQMPHEDSEKELDSSGTVMPKEDASSTQDSEDYTAPDIVCSLAACSSRNIEKPKRRLLPASSILLKDIGSLAVDDEIGKPKGARGEKKVAVETRNKSKGSISLLRLLRNDLYC